MFVQITPLRSLQRCSKWANLNNSLVAQNLNFQEYFENPDNLYGFKHFVAYSGPEFRGHFSLRKTPVSGRIFKWYS